MIRSLSHQLVYQDTEDQNIKDTVFSILKGILETVLSVYLSIYLFFTLVLKFLFYLKVGLFGHPNWLYRVVCEAIHSDKVLYVVI